MEQRYSSKTHCSYTGASENTKLYSNLEHVDEILNQIFEQNLFLMEKPIKIKQFHTIEPPNSEPYKNIILSRDLQTHRKLQRQGYNIFGFRNGYEPLE